MGDQTADGWTRAALVVGAAIRDNAVLLVHEQTLGGKRPDQWVLPGGRVEPGELLDAAVKREVGEETGLSVRAVGPVAFGTQHYLPGRSNPLLYLAFHVELSDPAQRLAPNDPDGLILEARFVPIPDAVGLVRRAGISPATQSTTDFLTKPIEGSPVIWLWDLNTSAGGPVAEIPAAQLGQTRT